VAAAGAAAPVCIAIHALLDDAAMQDLRRAGASRFVSCDTVVHPSNAIALAPRLARAVRAVSRPSSS
jgi:ribose-phosphate pyrophosphokinase